MPGLVPGSGQYLALGELAVVITLGQFYSSGGICVLSDATVSATVWHILAGRATAVKIVET